MKKCALLGLALVLAVSACRRKTETPPAAGQDMQQILQQEEILAFVALPNPAATLSNLEKLATLFGPVPPGMLQGFIIQGLLSLGLKDTSVVDLNSPSGFIVLDPKKFAEPLALIVSVKGEDEVLKALQPAWKHQGAKEKVHQLSREKVDTYGVFAGGQHQSSAQQMFLAFSGKQAICGRSPEVIKLALPLAGMFKKSPGGDLVGAANIARLRKLFAAELDLARQQMNIELERDFRVTNPTGGTDILRLTQKVAGWLFSFLEQIDQVEFSLSASERLAAMSLSLLPAGNSTFARLLADQKKAPLKLLSALPEDHPIAFAMNIQWDALKPELEKFTREIFETMLKNKPSEEFLALLKQMWQVMGDEIVLSEQIGGGLELVEVFSIKDEKLAREVFKKAFSLMNQFMKDLDFGRLGFEFTGPQPAGKIGEAEVDLFEVKFLFKEDDPQSKAMAEAMKVMYGGSSLKLATTISNGALFLTMSPEPRKLLERALESVKKPRGGFAGSAALRSAGGEDFEKSGGFMFLSVSSLVRQSARLATLGQTGQAPDAIPPSKSGLYFGGYSENGKFKLVFRAPAEHLQEIGESIKGLMGGAMQ